MIRYIIFDKDGTLIDFEAFWGNMTVSAVRDILKSVGADVNLTEEIMEIYGYHDGVADITGLFAGGTYEMITDATYELLTKKGYELEYNSFYKLLKDKFHEHSSAGELKAACDDIQGFLEKLKEKGIQCAVVTSDDSVVAKKCLDELGIASYFDAIYAADGVEPAKPDPYYINKLCAEKGLEKDEVLMVGDTLIDIEFARNGGIKVIGVAKNDKNRNTLLPLADAVVHDISKIFDVMDEI